MPPGKKKKTPMPVLSDALTTSHSDDNDVYSNFFYKSTAMIIKTLADYVTSQVTLSATCRAFHDKRRQS